MRKGVPRNYEVAAKWRNLDAGYGYANAKKDLGVMYVTLVPLRNGEF